MITIQSNRVGTMEISEDRVITFPEGIVGFTELKRFIVADDPNDPTMPFKWLIPLENPDMIFLVTDPGIFFNDYAFDLEEEHKEFIGARTEDDVSVITLLTVPSDPSKITSNLRAPLVINWRSMVGRQLILRSTNYQTKHYIFIQRDAVENEKVSTASSALDENTNVLLGGADALLGKDGGALTGK